MPTFSEQDLTSKKTTMGRISKNLPFVALLGLLNSQGLCQSKVNRAAEAWVAERVKVGGFVNLKHMFPKDEDRILSASFLDSLLSGLAQTRRQGVRLFNARFVGHRLQIQFSERTCV